MGKFQIWHPSSFGCTTKLGREAEELGERYFRGDDARFTALAHRFDGAALTIYHAIYVAHELLGDDDFKLHDGLEDDGLRFLRRLLEGIDGRELKGDLGRVDIVVGAVVEIYRDIDDRESGEDAALHCLFDAFFDRR